VSNAADMLCATPCHAFFAMGWRLFAGTCKDPGARRPEPVDAILHASQEDMDRAMEAFQAGLPDRAALEAMLVEANGPDAPNGGPPSTLGPPQLPYKANLGFLGRSQRGADDKASKSLGYRGFTLGIWYAREDSNLWPFAPEANGHEPKALFFQQGSTRFGALGQVWATPI